MTRLQSSLIFVLLCLPLLAACPKAGSNTASGSQEPDTWVLFEVVQAGTGNSIETTVWPKGLPDHFETVVAGDAGSEARFFGLGRTEAGYALPFEAGRKTTLHLWSPGHEMDTIEVRPTKGENRVIHELVIAVIEDTDVPEKIRTEVLQSLPSQGPKSGS